MKVSAISSARREALVERYASPDSALADRLGGPYGDLASYRAAIERVAARAFDRESLVDRLLTINSATEAGERTRENILALRMRDTFAVVTGQQPGFLTGPLYTALKAASTIALARHLQESLGVPCVPVFWVASDDHDLAEIEGCHVLGRAGEVRRFRLDLSPRTSPSSALTVTADAAARFQEVLETAGDADFAQQVTDGFSPRPGERWAVWFGRQLHRMFPASGLVLFEPHGARDLVAPTLLRELRSPALVRDALRQGASSLRGLGLDAPLPVDRSSALFITRDQHRQRHEPDVVGPEGAAAILGKDPHAFTADAALRPVVQSCVVPTAAVVGGPGELAYWLQLTECFEAFDAPRPVFLPRHTAVLVEPKLARILAGLGSSVAAVLADDGKALTALSSAPAPSLEGVRSAIAQALVALDRVGEELDAHGRQVNKKFAGLRKTHSAALDRLARQAETAAAVAQSASRQQAEFAVHALRPRGRMQDRVLSPLPFLARFGPDLFERVAARIDPISTVPVEVLLEAPQTK